MRQLWRMAAGSRHMRGQLNATLISAVLAIAGSKKSPSIDQLNPFPLPWEKEDKPQEATKAENEHAWSMFDAFMKQQGGKQGRKKG